MAATHQSDTCPHCGRAKLKAKAQCRYCTFRYDTCPNCGARKMKKAALCQACKALTFVHAGCKECGKRIGKGRTYCRPCERKLFDLMPRCVDCGTQVKRQYSKGHFALRCWPCEVLHRRAEGAAKRAAKPACSMDGCAHKEHAKGLCRHHYNRSLMHEHAMVNGSQNKGAYQRMLAFWPCQACGYDRFKSDVHRIVPGAQGGEYTPGNMVALCARCHKEVERGLTPCPTPPTVQEIESAHAARTSHR